MPSNKNSATDQASLALPIQNTFSSGKQEIQAEKIHGKIFDIENRRN
jgi:hypothetical protein